MKKILKRLGVGIGALVILIALGGVGVFGFSSVRMNKSWDRIPAEPFEVPSDSATIARGRHLAVAIAKCTDCHGDNLAGKVFIEDPVLGRLVTSNLTRGKGGVGDKYDDAHWARAIRHGVKYNGMPAVFMPSTEYINLTKEDLQAIIAYVKSVPPVDSDLPRNSFRLARLLYVTGAMPLVPAEIIDHSKGFTQVAAGPTVEYGNYITTVGGCKSCHTETLGGGKAEGPGLPVSKNITRGGIGNWTEADFTRALRTGTRPDGSRIDPFMPWAFTASMTDEEIKAVWLYIQSIPPVQTAAK